MTARRMMPLVALAVAVVALAVPLSAGPGEARLGAGFGLAGIVAGLAAVVRTRRIEHGDDEVAPSSVSLIVASMSDVGLIIVGTATYLAAVVLAGVVRGPGPRDSIGWDAAVLASVAFVGAAIFLAGGVQSVRRREGIERTLLVEATSIAFFTTMVAALGYATFEAFADAPTISMWAVWGVGGLSWAIAAAVLHHRAS